MINPKQLRQYVVIPTLLHLTPHIPCSAEAVELLMGTAAQESDCGTYLHQLNGPALGVWQMEPATAENHRQWLNLPANSELFVKVWQLAAVYPDYPAELVTNLMLACAMARIHYWRAPGPIPTTIEGQAAYWKRYYNTELGAGTVEQYLANWKRISP